MAAAMPLMAPHVTMSGCTGAVFSKVRNTRDWKHGVFVVAGAFVAANIFSHARRKLTPHGRSVARARDKFGYGLGRRFFLCLLTEPILLLADP